MAKKLTETERILTTGMIVMFGAWTLRFISFYSPFPFDGILYVIMNVGLMMSVIKGIAPGLLKKIPP